MGYYLHVTSKIEHFLKVDVGEIQDVLIVVEEDLVLVFRLAQGV